VRQLRRSQARAYYAGVKCIMSIEDLNSVDFIGIENNEKVILTISDHLAWNKEHLLLLQEKLNLYLSFIESGEILESYPDAQGKDIKIIVVCKHQPTEEALAFMANVSSVISQAGFEFGHECKI
jgi:hypothetical protein